MPFTIGGDYIPGDKSEPQKPLKAHLQKRKGFPITIVDNLPRDTKEQKALLSQLKRQLSCGGTIKQGKIELQGDHLEKVKSLIREMGK